MASLPPVQLDTHKDWFNLLMTVLHQQAEQNPYEEYREMAQKLIDQFMRYGRLRGASDVPERGWEYHLAFAAFSLQLL